MATISQYGERSVLIEFDSAPIGLAKQFAELFPEATVRDGLKSLLLTFPKSGHYVEVVRDRLPVTDISELKSIGKTLRVPVTYDGADLNYVAKLLDLDVSEFISLHSSTKWIVALIGFAPGFPYLIPSTNQELFSRIGRLASPREKVPKNSVGIAAGMSCIYPQSSPGGWNLIGTADITLFNPDLEKPNLLDVGDEVIFEVLN